MVRLLSAVGLTVVVVTFGMMNTHHVQLSAVLGEPLRIRMIFLLALVFLGGSLSTVFYQMARRTFVRGDLRRMRSRKSGTDGVEPE